MYSVMNKIVLMKGNLKIMKSGTNNNYGHARLLILTSPACAIHQTTPQIQLCKLVAWAPPYRE